ncbi:MAG: TIGR00303 family protein [Leptolyngbya sp. SIO4C5]|uniref:nicotinate mononucleotide-dependent phosphoribosyltransferase CobT n=1 Tax=Sphaerothrix gracilis TaxID=3151835 RepID=UPI0013C083D5|nr:TIGR00303 family protein [Leptolyngbya sp. SIO4C5]
MIRICTHREQAQDWLARYRQQLPLMVCVLGFTETALIPGISAAGATPTDRRYTAIADAEFLYHGPRRYSQHPLPPLIAGASPVFISRAVIAAQNMPLQIINAGLPLPPAIPHLDLQGQSAACLSTGQAMTLAQAQFLFQQGLRWGTQMAVDYPNPYVVLSECVVGGTTTALAALLGLGFAAAGKINSSHPVCNHQQKQRLAALGLRQWRQLCLVGDRLPADPLDLIAAVGDPMQIAVAGMSIALSRSKGVLLAGGTQMLAVYALSRAIAQHRHLIWQPQNIVVGTTRWVVEDATGDTIGLARAIGGVPLLAAQIDFANAHYSQLRAYEQGYVKEGVGAGGCAIAAHLAQQWQMPQLLQAVEALIDCQQST